MQVSNVPVEYNSVWYLKVKENLLDDFQIWCIDFKPYFLKTDMFAWQNPIKRALYVYLIQQMVMKAKSRDA